MFSKSCNYAIKAAIFIAKHSLEENKVGFVIDEKLAVQNNKWYLPLLWTWN